MRLRTVIPLAGIIILAALWFIVSPPPQDRVLVFSHTSSFRHQHIPVAQQVFQRLGSELGAIVDTTENPVDFNDENLASYDVVVFLSTTGDVLNDSQQVAFQRFIQSGGAYMGIHAASDTEYEWPWYGQLVGGYFTDHPHIQEASLDILLPDHPVTKHLPAQWTRTDEWYNIRFVNANITPLISIDETTYDPGNDISEGDSHPLVWEHFFDGGASLYIQPGHTIESWSEDAYLEMVKSGLQRVLDPTNRPEKAAKLTPRESDFTREVLIDNLNEPMELVALPDGKVLFTQRAGLLRLYNPESSTTTTAAEFDVSYALEDGLHGIAADPNFIDNNWLYLYYSDAEETLNRVSRFTFDGSKLDMSSEVPLLEVPTQRVECCHAGGSLAFGPDGSLYLSTGDNTNPFASDGYSPSDESPGRAPWDAQGTSSNSMDLRGKILRLRPMPDGSVVIPEGNLFLDPSEGRPEIFVMGNRNPFRLSVDSKTGWLYWGEIGPDASDPSEERGPQGYDEINQARTAGYFGWPLFIADNKAYQDWDFAREKGNGWYDPASPVNDSPNNTGARDLPPAQPAFIWYPYGKSVEFPLFKEGGRSAMAGPIFHAEDLTASSFPDYFEGKLFVYEWMRNQIYLVTMDESGAHRYMEPFLSGTTWSRPMDMTFGQDGSLYVLEYGTAWNIQNEDARLTRITYNR